MLNTQAKASESLEVLFWVNRVNDKLYDDFDER